MAETTRSRHVSSGSEFRYSLQPLAEQRVKGLAGAVRPTAAPHTRSHDHPEPERTAVLRRSHRACSVTRSGSTFGALRGDCGHAGERSQSVAAATGVLEQLALGVRDTDGEPEPSGSSTFLTDAS